MRSGLPPPWCDVCIPVDQVSEEWTRAECEVRDHVLYAAGGLAPAGSVGRGFFTLYESWSDQNKYYIFLTFDSDIIWTIRVGGVRAGCPGSSCSCVHSEERRHASSCRWKNLHGGVECVCATGWSPCHVYTSTASLVYTSTASLVYTSTASLEYTSTASLVYTSTASLRRVD